MTHVISSRELIARLELERHALSEKNPLVAFDADGTLWSGDVGNDVFNYAAEHELFRESLHQRLVTEATQHGLSLDLEATVGRLAMQFVDAYYAGDYGESPLCALQAWCYAGMRETEVHELTRVAIGDDFAGRIQAEVAQLLGWARGAGLRCVVVSASPLQVVEAAAADLGFLRPDIVAARPMVTTEGVIAATLEGEVPYAAEKVSQGRAHFGDVSWLAAFGDNSFDAAMLQSAAVGVAVRPKDALAALLPVLSNVVQLAQE